MSTLDSRNPLVFPDLFHDILDCFYPEVHPRDARALLALAQTRRALSEPSLNRLWRKLHSLQPLVRCYTRAEDVANVVPPTPSQLAIIDRYSYRIRELTIFDSVSVRFLQCISLRPFCLFPNLMVLHWNTPYVADIPIIFIQRLLSPALISLEATLAEVDGATLLSFLNSYPLLCRNLRSIEFRFSAEVQSEATVQALSRAICNQGSLESATLHLPIDEVALKHLSALPTLKTLSVTLSEISRPRIVTLGPSDALFRGVELLEFSVWDLDLVTLLLRPLDQVFHTFRLYHRGRQTSEAVLGFLNLLTSRPRTIPLFEVTLSFGDFSHPIPADRMELEIIRYRLSYETLRPLKAFESLRELMIEWSDQLSLDDNELASLARSWPSLQVFYIYCGRGGYAAFPTKHVTFRGLLWLIHSCPKLQTVGLPLDARQIPMVNEADARETNFACLIIPESPIDAAHPVAEFLFKYLPCVTSVDARFLRPPGTDVSRTIAYECAWKQVERHLRVFHDLSSDGYGSEGSDD